MSKRFGVPLRNWKRSLICIVCIIEYQVELRTCISAPKDIEKRKQQIGDFARSLEEFQRKLAGMTKGNTSAEVKPAGDNLSEKQRVSMEMDKMSNQQLHKETEKVIDSYYHPARNDVD
jgi:hypothetical protein